MSKVITESSLATSGTWAIFLKLMIVQMRTAEVRHLAS